MTAKEKKFYVASAIRSRLLFPSVEEGELVLKVQLKTWIEKEDEQQINDAYYLFNRFSFDSSGENLKDMVDWLIDASRLYNDPDLWKGKREQSKQIFALKLFFWTYFSNLKFIYELIPSDVKPTKEELSLFKVFCSDSVNIIEDSDVIYFLLLCFGVIKPFNVNSKPRKDGREIHQSLDKFIYLMKSIREYWPETGALKGFPEYDSVMKQINEALEENTSLPVAKMWSMLREIIALKEIRLSPGELTSIHESADTMMESGIWIDDNDNGKNRFWVFPQNLNMLFCYTYEFGIWKLLPYEWMSQYNPEEEAYIVTVITPEGSYTGLRNGKLDSEFLTSVIAEKMLPNEEEYTENIKISQLSINSLLLDFQTLMRLKKDSPLHKKYMEILKGIYISPSVTEKKLNNPFSSVLNAQNGFVAMDREFIYVADLGVTACRLWDETNKEDFVYTPFYPSKNQPLVKMLEEKRFEIFAIPASEEGFQESDKMMNTHNLIKEIDPKAPTTSLNSELDITSRVRKEMENYRRFKEAALATRFPAQITIYHFKDDYGNDLRRICFNSSLLL